MEKKREKCSINEMMARYPRITAHIISESLGYATPSCAVVISRNAKEGKDIYCEWIYSRYGRNPRPAVQNVIKHRHHYKGFMADYKMALALVGHAIKTRKEPLFASWF